MGLTIGAQGTRCPKPAFGGTPPREPAEHCGGSATVTGVPKCSVPGSSEHGSGGDRVCARHSGMGFYRERLFPRIMNALMNTKETRRIRERVCAPLRGEVVEIGFGTGHNLPFMPATVTRQRHVSAATIRRSGSAPPDTFRASGLAKPSAIARACEVRIGPDLEAICRKSCFT